MKRIGLSLLFVVQIAFAGHSKNDSIIAYVVKNGTHLAPTYEKVVCTSFLVNVLKHFTPISKTDYRKIHIITNKSISTLIRQKSEIPNGVCYALVSTGRGKYVTLENALSGDFIQFWNGYFGFYVGGHCGIFHHYDAETKEIYMYSSHPSTGGYGLQAFKMPDYYVLARMQ